MYEQNTLIEELFNKTRSLDSFDDLIYELKNNVFIFLPADQEFLILKNAIQCLLKKWSRSFNKESGEEGKHGHGDFLDTQRVVSMIMTYIEDFYERYSDQADQMVTIILQVINIHQSDQKFTKRKQDILRKSLLFITNFEIIDTVANIYVDLV